MAPQFQINFDTRTKEILLDCLFTELIRAEDAIRSGDYSTEALTRYEELLRVRRGILYVQPQELDDKSGNWYHLTVYIMSTMNPDSRRVVTTHKQLEELVLDITQHDLNHQMQRLIAEHRKTGDESLLLDAEYLRSEFETWWDADSAEFVPPAQIK